MDNIKLQKARELQEVEHRKYVFRKQIQTLNLPSYIEGTVSFDIKTHDYREKEYGGGTIFTTELMKKYLEAEIDYLTERSKTLLQEMMEIQETE